MRTGMFRLRSTSNQLTSVITAEYRTAGGTTSSSLGDTSTWLVATRGDLAIAGCGKHITDDTISNTTASAFADNRRQAACGFARSADKQKLLETSVKVAFLWSMAGSKTVVK